MRYRTCTSVVIGAICAWALTAQGQQLEDVERQLAEAGNRAKTVKAQVTIRRTGASVSSEGPLIEMQTGSGRKSRLELAIVPIAQPKTQGSGKPKQDAEKVDEKSDATSNDFIDHGYVAMKTDFCLGYLLSGVANVALGRDEEASDNFREVLNVNENLRGLVEKFTSSKYNTILVVDYGLGPVKSGEDFLDPQTGRVYGKFLVRFAANAGWPSGEETLQVLTGKEPADTAPIVCDLNAMAADHLWAGLEDIRVDKMRVVVFLIDWANNINPSNAYEIAGKLAILASAAVIAQGAQPDLRYCDIMPQRVYFMPAMVTQANTTISLRLSGQQEPLVVVPGINPPRGDAPQLLYIRVPPSSKALPWLTSGKVLYANDEYSGDVSGGDIPYILGGRCVCRPSAQILQKYQNAGYLEGMSLQYLEELYRQEGVELESREEMASLHVLEGGRSLACPRVGSVGFMRLFCQEHNPYRPRSELVQQWEAKCRAIRESRMVPRVLVPTTQAAR